MIDVYSMQSTDGTEVSLKQRTNNLPETERVVALLAFALHRKPQGSDSIMANAFTSAPYLHYVLLCFSLSFPIILGAKCRQEQPAKVRSSQRADRIG
jgi:hypothetical protein